MSSVSPKKCQVVQVCVQDNKLVNDFDVYIDHEATFAGAQLFFQKSRWANPYDPLVGGQEAASVEEMEKACELYKTHLLETKRHVLHELRGRKLGCFCDPSRRGCHGQVLAKMVNELPFQDLRANVLFMPGQRQADYCIQPTYFKGRRSPLSNFYPSTVEYQEESFKTVAHAFAYAILQHLGLPDTAQWAKDRLDAYSAHKVMVTMTELADNKTEGLSSPQQIVLMKQLLDDKWNRYAIFQEAAELADDQHVVHAIGSRYWGAGVDLAEVDPKQDPFELPGRNLLGWIIKYITFERRHWKTLWNYHVTELQKAVSTPGGPWEGNAYAQGMLIVDKALQGAAEKKQKKKQNKKKKNKWQQHQEQQEAGWGEMI